MYGNFKLFQFNGGFFLYLPSTNLKSKIFLFFNFLKKSDCNLFLVLLALYNIYYILYNYF